MGRALEELWKKVNSWQDQMSEKDSFPYHKTFDDILFHAERRFNDYLQFRDEEGSFIVRLQRWLNNMSDEEQQKALFRLLRWIIFIDEKQMQSLYRDAFRSKVIPWLTRYHFTRDDLLSRQYKFKVLELLEKYYLRSVTESFNGPTFTNVNNLIGIPKLKIIGEDIERACSDVKKLTKENQKLGIIIFEDMVGTGKQASRVIGKISKYFPTHWRSLFVPLIIQENGFKNFQEKKIRNLDIEPVIIIRNNLGIQREPNQEEPDEFNYTRGLVNITKSRVLESLNEYDDPPTDPFGYENSGALVVTSHNVPNNTIPLIHHRAPAWAPLFRRLHHSKEK